MGEIYYSSAKAPYACREQLEKYLCDGGACDFANVVHAEIGQEKSTYYYLILFVSSREPPYSNGNGKMLLPCGDVVLCHFPAGEEPPFVIPIKVIPIKVEIECSAISPT